MHWLRQTPWSVHLSSWVMQRVGTYSLPAWMIGSGTQRPEVAPVHAAKALPSDAGRLVLGTQWEGPYLQQLAPGRDDGFCPG